MSAGLIDLTVKFGTSSSEYITTDLFGVEYLGWEPGLFRLDESLEAYSFQHLRWPGGQPPEDPWTIGIDESRLENPTLQELAYGDFLFDLADPNYVDWYRSNGSEREGIEDIVQYATMNGVSSLSIVTPSARYAARMLSNDGSIDRASVESVVSQTKADMLVFLTNLYYNEDGTKRVVPENITIEIGSEYYATKLWSSFMSGELGEDRNVALVGLKEAFGLSFAAQVHAIRSFELLHGVEINTAIQLARIQCEDVFWGSSADNQAFIDAFSSEFIGSDAISGVDAVIWHRYYTYWEGLDNHLSDDESKPISSFIDAWQAAGAGEDGSLDLVVGWMAPALQTNFHESKYLPNLMLQLFSNLVSAGADMATVFGANTNSVGALAFKSDVMIGGQLYDLMSELLPGTRIQDAHFDNLSFLDNLDGAWLPKPESEDINKFLFDNEYSRVAFFTVGNISDSGLLATVEFDGAFSHFSITYISPAGSPINIMSPSGIPLGYAGEVESFYEFFPNKSGLDSTSIDLEFGADFTVAVVEAVIQTIVSDQNVDLRSVPEKYQDKVNDIKLFGTGQLTATGNDRGNKIEGSADKNKIWGLDGNDVIDGYGGDDIIFGGDGVDLIGGGLGNDWLNGGNGHDKVWGGSGDDSIFLAGGSDAAFGMEGNDTIRGGGGNDWIEGGPGADVLSGGGGSDTFVFRDASGIDDVITDFEVDKDVFRIVCGGQVSFDDLSFSFSSLSNLEGLLVSWENDASSTVSVFLSDLVFDEIGSIRFDFL